MHSRTYILECPYQRIIEEGEDWYEERCGAEVVVEVYKDWYGGDADGNRYVQSTFAEIVSIECDHRYHEYNTYQLVEDKLTELAIERYEI